MPEKKIPLLLCHFISYIAIAFLRIVAVLVVAVAAAVVAFSMN